jgi:hypothetical protein
MMGLRYVEPGEMPLPPKPKFFLGLDLGQSADFSALCIARQVGTAGAKDCRYEVVGLKRYELGTAYPAVVADVKETLGKEPLRSAETRLAVDATGVGPPVVDMFRQAGLKPKAITITGGNTVNRDGDDYNVPKRDLVSCVQVLLQSERLKIATRLPHAATLQRELLNFKVKITLAANDTYGVWREGLHDDLVLALAMACWAGEHIKGSRAWGFS